jgi:Spy/CpxP family protein refolding chaperone
MAAAVVALVASPALAQRQRPQGQGGRQGGPGGGAMSGLMLLGQKSVQDELKLTDDQVAKIKAAGEKQREALGGGLSREEAQQKRQELAKENEKLVADLLKPDQAKRLKQISLQVQGARALANPDIAKQLNITEDQKRQIQEIQQEAGQQLQGLFQGGDREAAQKKMAEVRKSTNEKVMKLMTADQQAKWKEMTGEPFKGEISLFPAGGRRPNQQRP